MAIGEGREATFDKSFKGYFDGYDANGLSAVTGKVNLRFDKKGTFAVNDSGTTYEEIVETLSDEFGVAGDLLSSVEAVDDIAVLPRDIGPLLVYKSSLSSVSSGDGGVVKTKEKGYAILHDNGLTVIHGSKVSSQISTTSLMTGCVQFSANGYVTVGYYQDPFELALLMGKLKTDQKIGGDKESPVLSDLSTKLSGTWTTVDDSAPTELTTGKWKLSLDKKLTALAVDEALDLNALILELEQLLQD